MTKILFISNLFPPVILGGYEIACANVAHELHARGHKIRVLTTWSHLVPTSPDPAYVERTMDSHWHTPMASGNPALHVRDLHYAVCSSFGNTAHLIRSLRAFRPDVVYVWNLTGVGSAALMDILNMSGFPWVLHLMDRTPVDIVENVPEFVLGLYAQSNIDLFSRAYIISMSQSLLDEIASVGGVVFPQGASIIPGWADVSQARAHSAYRQNGTTRFVTAGAVTAHKGIDLILQASAILAQANLAFEVDVFGGGEISKYIEMAHRMGLSSRVRFLGPRAQGDLIRAYADYDAFLFPTWEREPFGFAPVEAAGCGTPPIMTANCGASERLIANVHCLKIELTVNDLTDAMARVAAGRVDLDSLGRAGQRLVSTDLSLERCVDAIEEILTTQGEAEHENRIDDPGLTPLAFLKHNLSVSLRFG